MYIGIELGGTKVVLAAGGSAASVGPVLRFPTVAPEVTLASVTQAIADLATQQGPVRAIGVASFGPIRLDRAAPDYGAFLDTPKAQWRDFDLMAALAKAFPEVPLALDTDVNGAVLAEARWGAGQGCDTLAYVTVGTGVGVGLYVRGAPVHGFLHPEAGHMLVRRHGPGDNFAGICPYHGDCLEGLVSGPAVAARLGVPAESVADDHPVWADVGGHLAQLFYHLTLFAAPQRIIVGGGVGLKPVVLHHARRRLFDLLGGYYRDFPTVESIDRFVVPAGLADRAGVLGAMALAEEAA
jgi:fructokinase